MRYDLLNIAKQCEGLIGISKNCLHKGDIIYIKTNNSTYLINVDDNEQFIVSGGWFDKNNLSPLKIKINGCTWGGTVIKTDIIAACGLHLEFGNNLLTSKITTFFYLSRYQLN